MSVDVNSLRRVVATSAATVIGVQAAAALLGMPRGRRDYADGA